MNRFLLPISALCLICFAPATGRADGLGVPLADAELDEQRGGFVSAAGLTFDFSAELITFIDGQVALQSRLSLGDPQLAQINSMALPDGASIFHRFDSEGLANILINSSDNRTFRQELNVTLTLPGFNGVQQGFDAVRIGSDLARQISVIAGLR